MEVGKRTTTARGYKDWGRQVIYDKNDLVAIKEAQGLDNEKSKRETLVVLGAYARIGNQLLSEANPDDFIESLDSALRQEASSYMGPYILEKANDAYFIDKGVRSMDSILDLVRIYPAMRNVILEALSSPDNEREETE